MPQRLRERLRFDLEVKDALMGECRCRQQQS